VHTRLSPGRVGPSRLRSVCPFAPLICAQAKTLGFTIKAKKIPPVLSRLASVDNASDSTTGFTRSDYRHWSRTDSVCAHRQCPFACKTYIPLARSGQNVLRHERKSPRQPPRAWTPSVGSIPCIPQHRRLGLPTAFSCVGEIDRRRYGCSRKIFLANWLDKNRPRSEPFRHGGGGGVSRLA
jgi:hypothetical protein